VKLPSDRARVGTNGEDEAEADHHDPTCREPGDDECLRVELLAGEERPEDERAERSAEERPEEDGDDRAAASNHGDLEG